MAVGFCRVGTAIEATALGPSLAQLVASRSVGQALSPPKPLSRLGLAQPDRAWLLGLASFQARPADHYPSHTTVTAPHPCSIPQHAMMTVKVEVPRVSMEDAETTGDDSDDNEH